MIKEKCFDGKKEIKQFYHIHQLHVIVCKHNSKNNNLIASLLQY